MLAYIFYGIRTFFRMIGNLFRRVGKPPDYVIFTLEGEYPECWDPPGGFIQRRLRPPRLSLQELTEQFRMIADDPRIRGIVLHIRPLAMELARLEILRDLILELRCAGKRVVAWSTSYGLSTYFVATAADEVHVQPGGSIMGLGLSKSYTFLADALEKVGVQADILQISPYKSSGDVFSRREMSDELREMSNRLMDAAFREIIAAISAGRGIIEDEARDLVDQTPCTDLKAVELGIIDQVINEEDLPEHLGVGDQPARLATWEDSRSKILHRPLPRPGRYVALLAIEGMIWEGESSRPPIQPPLPIPIMMEPRAGDLSVVQAARKALHDKRAAAVVLYVNSRGGLATASEAMCAALQRINAVKPLIVSMGPMATSGGYYVASSGHHIMAQPSTVTGSIGVIMGKIVTGTLLDKIFFGREAISRGKYARILDSEQGFNEEEREIMWEMLTRSYDLFLERVSQSRKKSPEEIDAVSRGRVWTGRQAVENGLADELGGLDLALAKARQLGGLHKHAPVRMILPDRRRIPPAASPAAALEYALEGARIFQWGTTLLLCPYSWDMD